MAVLTLLVGCAVLARVSEGQRVGIVGSGVAGASAAYFVRELYPNATIVVFERGAEVGGRAKNVIIDQATVDAGATAISTLNRYLVHFVSAFSLTKRAPTGGKFGIWDGDAFRLMFEEQPSVIGEVALAKRYGLTSIVKLKKKLAEMVEKLNKVYDLQSDGVAYESPKQLFEALGLYEETQRSAYDLFDEMNLSTAFIGEFIDGASRDNYNQPGTLNAFADLVSLAGAGLEGSLFELQNGTVQIPRGLIDAADVDLRLETEVTKIEKEEGGFVVHASSSERFDSVILATPVEFTEIALPVSVAIREYEPNYVSFAVGTLASSLFGEDASRLETVLTVENDAIPFSCIGAHGRVNGSILYKVMSRGYLDDAAFDMLFEDRSEITRVSWNSTGAYTKLQPSEDWPQFALQEGLFYTAAMESAVSCMETQIIAAKNAALLLKSFLEKKKQEPNDDDDARDDDHLLVRR